MQTITVNIVTGLLLIFVQNSYSTRRLLLNAEHHIKLYFKQLSKTKKSVLSSLMIVLLIFLMNSELLYHFLQALEQSPFKYAAMSLAVLFTYRCLGAKEDEMQEATFYMLVFLLFTVVVQRVSLFV